MPLRNYSEAERIVTERRRLERPLLLTVWLGMAAFSLAEGSAFYFLAGTVGVVISLWAARRSQEVYLRRGWVNAGVLASTAVVLVDLLGGGPLIQALGHYLILIQLCKLFERRGYRDCIQLLVMSLLVVVAAVMVQDALWLGAVVLAHLVMVCHTSMVLTLKRGLDEVASARLSDESAPQAPDRVAWSVMRDWPARALRGRLAVAMAFVLAGGVLVFLAAPRIRQAGAALSSLHSTGWMCGVRLQDRARVRLSNRPVLRFRVEGRRPHQNIFYLRAAVHYEYGNSRWRPARVEPISPDLGLVPEGNNLVNLSATVSEDLAPQLFVPYPTLEAQSTAGVVDLGAAGQAVLSDSAAWRRRQQPVEYQAWCWNEPLTPRQRAYLVRQEAAAQPRDPPRLVYVSPPVRELAEQWCGGLDRRSFESAGAWNLAVARVIERKLRSQYAYSLEVSGYDPRRDGVEDFLFHLKRGHCEYFASAQAVLCSAMGVPARLVSGFRPDSAPQKDGQYVVRARDAHAWVEILGPEGAWVRIDPTPGADEIMPTTWWQSLQLSVQRVRDWWDQHISGYDADKQRGLLGAIRGWLASLSSAVKSAYQAVYQAVLNLIRSGQVDEALVEFIIALGVVAAGIEALVVVRMVRRSQRRRQRLQMELGEDWRELIFLPALFRRLARLGVQDTPDRTLRELAAEASELLGLDPARLGSLVSIYYRARWSPTGPSSEEVAAARAEAQAIDRSLRR